MYENTEIVIDTIPSNHINNLPDRFNEAILKTTELSMEQNDSVMKKTNST